MKKLIALFLCVIGLLSCKSNLPEDDNETKTVRIEETFEGIEVLFDEKEFSDPKMKELLEELKICGTSDVNEDQVIPDCSPEFFKFFPLGDSISLENGFLLLTKANTGGIALRRLLVFERERGNLVKVNGFIANIIGKRKSKTGYDDLLLRFKDVIDGSDFYYNCLFTWEGGQYRFKSVEVIDEPAVGWRGHVRPDVKDSVSKEIYQIITDNQMIF